MYKNISYSLCYFKPRPPLNPPRWLLEAAWEADQNRFSVFFCKSIRWLQTLKYGILYTRFMKQTCQVNVYTPLHTPPPPRPQLFALNKQKKMHNKTTSILDIFGLLGSGSWVCQRRTVLVSRSCQFSERKKRFFFFFILSSLNLGAFNPTIKGFHFSFCLPPDEPPSAAPRANETGCWWRTAFGDWVNLHWV